MKLNSRPFFPVFRFDEDGNVEYDVLSNREDMVGDWRPLPGDSCDFEEHLSVLLSLYTRKTKRRFFVKDKYSMSTLVGGPALQQFVDFTCHIKMWFDPNGYPIIEDYCLEITGFDPKFLSALTQSYYWDSDISRGCTFIHKEQFSREGCIDFEKMLFDVCNTIETFEEILRTDLAPPK